MLSMNQPYLSNHLHTMAPVPMRSSGLEKHHDPVQKDTSFRIPKSTLEGKVFVQKCENILLHFTWFCLTMGISGTCFAEKLE